MFSKEAMIAVLIFANFAPMVVYSQGGSEGESEGTDVGANPPNALLGCNSPYTYLEANSRGVLETFHALVEGDQDVKAALKYRNLTGTFLMPTNAAFERLASTSGLRVLQPGALTTSLLQALLEYHSLFETIDPTSLAAQQGAQVFDTALALDDEGGNAKLDVPVWQLFAEDPATLYENVTITVAPVGVDAQAPAGTYRVSGGASQANIIWDDITQPVRTCVGYIYLIDGVLLPTSDLTALNSGGTATAPLEAAGDSEGATVEAPSVAIAG